jgi:integrase
MAAGIEKRGGAYRASVWSARDEKRIRRTFPTLAAAKAWRQDAQVALRRGELRAPTPTTLREAAEAWLDGARDGRITTRSGERYKPSAVRSYETALRLRVLPELGDVKLADIRRVDLQEFVDGLRAQGLSPSTVQCTILPLRAIIRREVARGRLAVNPTTGLELPAVRGGRERIAGPEEAAALLAALPEEDRAVWATAMYAGLRRGELKALTVDAIDTTANVIHVHHGWDDKEGRIETKGKNRRRVPISSVLRRILLEHVARTGRRGGDLVFGRTATLPFHPGELTERADRAWTDLDRITLHECRHTFASLMIAAGVNAKALSTYMGHANISITLGKYGHLMPGNEEEAAELLDTYLLRATGVAK